MHAGDPFLFQLFFIFVWAKLFGEIFERLQLPAVLGEILAGVLVGPSVANLVTPDEATQLTMGATDGKIQLALRNTIDTKKNEPKAIVQAALFSPQGAVATPVQPKPSGRKAAPAAPPPYVIEVITGNKRENKSFPNSGSSSEKQ